MTNDDMIKAIAENTQRSKSNSHRIDDLERNAELLHQMVTALEVLGTQQKAVAEQVEKIDAKVSKLEQAPGKKQEKIWEQFMTGLLTALAGMLAGMLVSHFGF